MQCNQKVEVQYMSTASDIGMMTNPGQVLLLL